MCTKLLRSWDKLRRRYSHIYLFRNLLLPATAKPTRPVPKNIMVAGSGISNGNVGTAIAEEEKPNNNRPAPIILRNKQTIFMSSYPF
jgi:hypothetical protein